MCQMKKEPGSVVRGGGGLPGVSLKMDVHLREEYMAMLWQEYQRGGRKQKSRLSDEAQKRTALNRKV